MSLKEKFLAGLNFLREKVNTSSQKPAIAIPIYIIAGLVTIFVLYAGVNFIRYGGKTPVEISAVSPLGEVPEKTNFTLEFTSDVVDENKVDLAFSPAEIPVIFTPSIPGRFKWLSPRMLRFFPESPLKLATPYTIEVLPKICLKENRYLRGTRKFDFYTPGLKIVHCSPRFIFERKIKLESRIEWSIEFNQDVSPDKLKENLKLYYDLKVGQKAIPFTIHPDDKPAKVFKIITDPVQKGKNEQCIKLRIDQQLTGISGSLGLSAAFIGDMTIEPNLKVYGVYSQESEREAWIRVELSSPVDSQIAKDNIKLDPAIDFRVEQDYRYLNLKGDFKSGQTYRIYISQGLPGEDGTYLQDDFSTTIRVEDLSPNVSFKHKGIFLCRKGNMNLGIESVNLKKFNIEVEKIFTNNLVYLLSHHEPTDYWDKPYNLGKKVYEKEMSIDSEKNRIVTTVLDIGEFIKGRKGIFRVSIWSDEEDYCAHDCQYVMVTDVGIAAKIAPDELFVWTNSLKTLTPLAGVEITLFSKENQTLATGMTDSNGVLTIKELKDKIEDFEPYLITAALGEDVSYLKFDDCRMPATAFDVGGRPHLSSGYEAYLYTDRGVFRPGENAHIVSIIRGKNVGLPQEFPVKLQLLDPTNRLFKEFSKTNNAMDEFEFNIPDYAKTGKYVAKLLVGEDEIGRCEFYVEDFIPDRIKVEITTDKKSYATGESAIIDVKGICLFGPPAAGRKVQAQCQIQAQPFTSKKWTDYTFGDEDKGFKEMNIELGENLLNDEGLHRFTLNIPKDIFPPATLKGIISTTVTESGGRAVSAYANVDIHPYPFYIGLRPITQGYVDVGKKYELDYVAVNPAEVNVRPKVLSASFYRIIWHSILKKDESGYYRYVSERSDELIKSFPFNPDELKRLTFVPDDYGEYKIVISDPQNKTASAVKFYASGWGYAPWSMANPDRIEIGVEKGVYAVGETAKVQIKAPFPGRLLLTVEREKVFNYQIMTMAENTAVINLPVEDMYKPNVYITATIIRSINSKDTYTPMRAFGIAPLMVNCNSTKMVVNITAPKVIRPKTKLDLTIQVNGQGENSRLTVAAVDEGICQLTDFQTPDPFGFFYAKKKLDVNSYDIYSFILPEVESTNKKTPSGDYMEKIRKKHITPVSVKRVKPVSLWSGIIKADAAGKATVSFNIPQFQGRLRIMAVAASGAYFGANRADVTVRDPIVLTSTLPRFLAPKDKFTIPVSVFNGCGKPGNFTVSLAIHSPVEIIGEATKVVSIANKKEKEVVFEGQTKEAIGKATFKLIATGLGEKTEEITELPVRPATPVITKSGSSLVTPNAPVEVILPGGWIPGSEDVSLVISTLPTIRFAGGLKYLLTYPHGCIEQTTSKVFPLIYFDDLAKIADPAFFKHNSAEYYLEEGIAKLESMQLDSGAFSYWPGESYVNEWGSVYASHFLVEAKKAGYSVSNYVYKKMISWLKELIKRQSNDGYALEQQVYACYVLSLAGEPPKGTILYLKENKLKELSLYSQFQLAGCFGLAGDLNTAKFLLPTKIHPETVERQTGGNFDSSVRANAIMLDILTQILPNSPGIPVLVKEVSESAKGGRWYTTQENAFAFLALGKVFKGQAQAKFTGEITVSGKPYQAFTQQGLSIEDKRLAGKKIRVQIQGKGNAYLYWQVCGIFKGVDVEETDSGLKVRRVFLDVNGKEINYQDLKQGELFVAKITMEALDKDLENVIICDMLPAGLEIENPRLESRANIPWIQEQGYTPNYMDMRDDRLLVYMFLPGKAERTFYYALRAVTCGEFALPPILAECMYDPTYISTASSGMVKIKAMK